MPNQTATIGAQSTGIVNIATGTVTSNGNPIDVIPGFTPRYVKVINETDVIIWEKLATQAAANSVKVVTAGTTTVDTGSAILLKGTGAADTYEGFQISSTAAGTSKVLHWVAYC